MHVCTQSTIHIIFPYMMYVYSFVLQDTEDKIKSFDGPLADLDQQEKKLRRDDETIRQEKVKDCLLKHASMSLHLSD